MGFGSISNDYAQFQAFTVANTQANLAAQETGMVGNTQNNVLAAETSPVIGLANTVGNLISGFEGALVDTTSAQNRQIGKSSFNV